MVSRILQTEIQRFINEVGEPVGVDVERVSPAAQERIRREYLHRVLRCDETVRRTVLDQFIAAWRDNADHGNRRRFGRASINLAHFCLSRTELQELSEQDLNHAVDSIARISRWHHTENNLWLRFRPYAAQAVDLLWGGIEKLTIS
jgi:hypothetical protein